MSSVTEKTYPDLFSLATKELSQDAVLAWLLQWADGRHSESAIPVQQALHRTGQSLVRALLKKHGHEPVEIKHVEADVQWRRIDLWAIVNKKFLIIIEDKTFTSAHSGQLQRYYEMALRYAQSEEDKEKYDKPLTLCPIYLKTTEEMKESLDKVDKAHYKHFHRRDLLRVLSTYAEEMQWNKGSMHEVPNREMAIIPSFWNHLVRIEKAQNWQRIPLKDWNEHTWMAFYQQLEKDGFTDHWHKVDNPSGGFWNALLSYGHLDGYPFYLQIEQGSLAFKVKGRRDHPDIDPADDLLFISKADMRQLLNHCRDWLMEHWGEPKGLHKPELPHRRTGKWMTVARVKQADWMGDEGRIDYKKVKRCLKDYLRHFEGMLGHAKARAMKIDLK